MNEFESDWISLCQMFRTGSWAECFWVSFREKKTKMAESKMAQIQDDCQHQVKWEWMSLSQIELVWVQSQNAVRVFLSESDRMITRCLTSKMAEAESDMAEFKIAAIINLSQNEWVKFFFVQNGWIQDGRVHDGCHHQVESEWMRWSEIELVWVRVLCK